jgi:hypothetical protein
MNRIYVPSEAAASWQRLLAQPEKHWKPSFSAMTLAQCWEDAGGQLPSEIQALLSTGRHSALDNPELLLAIPEYKVELPGGERATQTDVFALVRGRSALSACAVEGKVDEEFGPTIEAKRLEGAAERLRYLHELLEIGPEDSGKLRYQLFHRTAAAILLAQRFCAPVGVLIVHSFSPTHRWFADFEAFGTALGVQTRRGQLAKVGMRGGIELFIGWAVGDQRFRSDLSQLMRSDDSGALRPSSRKK